MPTVAYCGSSSGASVRGYTSCIPAAFPQAATLRCQDRSCHVRFDMCHVARASVRARSRTVRQGEDARDSRTSICHRHDQFAYPQGSARQTAHMPSDGLAFEPRRPLSARSDHRSLPTSSRYQSSPLAARTSARVSLFVFRSTSLGGSNG